MFPSTFTRTLSLAVAVAGIALSLLGPVPAGATDPVDSSAVRTATDGFHDLAAAQTAGYALLKDAAGISCIDDPTGAMGVHYANSDLVGSGVIDPLKPQALVYQPLADGSLSLAAVEYVVLQKDWDPAHAAPPTLFGQQFMLTPEGNRYGLPAFYSLHAWVWKANPSGEFAMWNPNVSCAHPDTNS
jgi:hypothetical protein